MTIAIAVRTMSAVVFATDSKLTATSISGNRIDESSNWIEHSYDQATKVVHDRKKCLMAMAVGPVNIGRSSSLDFIATQSIELGSSASAEDAAIVALLDRMAAEKQGFYGRFDHPIEPDDWPGPSLFLAVPSSEAPLTPRVWLADLSREIYHHTEILEKPGVWVDGSCDEVSSLLYGFHPTVSSELSKLLGPGDDTLLRALSSLRAQRPIDRLNLGTMPLQDAIDFAVFLASVQIEMERVLPTPTACGGAIDVMVLRMAPTPEIISLPGKSLHHPRNRGTVSP